MKLIDGDGIAEVGSCEALEHGSGFQCGLSECFERMGKTSYGSCRIQEESYTMHDLGIILGNLKLESTNDGEMHQLHPRVEQLPESQQQQDHDTSKDVDIKLIEEDTDDLVKLRAPTCEDYEEEDNNDAPDEDGVACLQERGPMHGIPARCLTAAMLHMIPMSPGRPADIPGHKRGMDDACQEHSKYFRLHDAEQCSLRGMSGHDVLDEVSSASGNCVKMVRQTSVKQMSGGTLYTSETSQPRPGQIIRDICDNPELNVTNCRLDVFFPESSISTGRNLNSFLPQPGSQVGQDSKEQVNEYQHVNLNLHQRYDQPSVGNFNKTLDNHHSKVCQQTTPQVPVAEWGQSGHGCGFSASSTSACSLCQHPIITRSDTTVYGSLIECSGCSTALHGSPTAMHQPHPVSHGSCTAFCSSSSALRRSLTPLLEPSAAMNRPPARLCGSPALCRPRTALCGPRTALYGPRTTLCGPFAALHESPSGLCGAPAVLPEPPATLYGSPSGLCVPPATLGGSAASLYDTPSALCGFPEGSLLHSPAPTIRSARSFDSGVCSPLSENSVGHPQPIKTVISCDQDSDSASVDSCIDEDITSSELNLILEFINQEMEEQKQQSQINPPRDSSVPPDSVTSHSFDGFCCSSMSTGSENMAQWNFPHPRAGIDCSGAQCASDNRLWPATCSNIHPLDGVPKPSVRGAPESMTAISNTSLPVASSQGHATVASIQGGALMVPVKLVVISQQAPPPKSSPTHYRPICPKTERASNPSGQAVNSVSQVGSSNADRTDTTACILPAREEQKQHKYSDVQKLTKARRAVAGASLDDLRNVDDDRENCVHMAVCQTDHPMVRALLERLVRDNIADMINAQNLQGQTPLYLATSTNNTKTVKVLVEYGADANLLAESMTSCGACQKLGAIHCASTKGKEYLDTLKALLAAPRIKLDLVNSEGHTALNCAVLSHGKMGTDNKPINSVSIIQALIRAGADPNIQVQQNGKTALMYALESRDLDLIEKTFQLVEPSQLYSFLRTQAFDGSSCLKIAKSLKTYLDPAGQKRLSNCLKLTARRVSL